MKKILLATIFCLPLLVLCGQEFAPISAEWYYDEQFAFSGDINYIKFTVDKDTLIAGKQCRKITKRHKLICLNRQYSEYLYSSNDTIYFFDKPDNEFKVLYNFNSSPQDSWTINVINEAQKTDIITVTVDSVSTISVND